MDDAPEPVSGVAPGGLIDALPPLLAARLRRLAQLWEIGDGQVVERVLERGLFECEAELRARFTPSEMDAWRAAIVALQREPDDAGFALIGRTDVVRGNAAQPGSSAVPTSTPVDPSASPASVDVQRETTQSPTSAGPPEIPSRRDHAG